MAATNITLSPVWAFPWQGVPELSYGRRVPLAPGNPRFRGGALCDHPHIFDLIRWLTGADFQSIFAEQAPNLRTDLEVEDLLLVNGKMTDGTTFLLDPSWSRLEERLAEPGPGWEVFPKRMEVNLTLHGEKGTLLADCFGPNVYHNGAPATATPCNTPTSTSGSGWSTSSSTACGTARRPRSTSAGTAARSRR